MSKVISFRLNSDNPREAQALTILYDWLSQGFSTRHTLTEALLSLSFDNNELSQKQDLINLAIKMEELLNNFEAVISQSGYQKRSSKGDLSDIFKTALIQAVRPGLKINTKNVLDSE